MLRCSISLARISGSEQTFSALSIKALTTAPFAEMVRALMDRAENVCSDPDILAKEIEHLSKVLHYNNYPQWMIKQQGKLEKQGPLIHPETGNEIQK